MNKIEEISHNLFKGKVITLPKPPSTNHIYAYTNRGGFARSYITKRGKDWFLEAELLLKSQWKNDIIKDNLGVHINLYCIRQDIDGIIKPILDLLQNCFVIENDNQITFLQVSKIKVGHRKDEKVEVVIDADRYS